MENQVEQVEINDQILQENDAPREPKIRIEMGRARFTPCKSDFDMEKHYLAFLVNNAFFAEISRNIKRIFTRDIETAGVMFDKHEDCFVFYINPDFAKTLNGKEIQGLIHHEYYHIIFNHCAMKLKPHKLWNIAQDLSINSIIKKHVDADGSHIALFAAGVCPGVRAKKPDGTDFSPEELKMYPLVEFVESLPPGQSSPQYFHALCDAGFDKIIKEDDEYYGFILDDHDREGMDESENSYVSARARDILEKAVKQADASGSWGNVPASLRTSLRTYLNRSVDWRSVLRQFVGYLNRGSKRSSFKKINRRYPMVHPGVQRSTQAKLLIAIDESGSVYDSMLEMFYSSLGDLISKVEIDLIPFDYTCNEEAFQTWRKGTRPEVVRTRGGGTNFDAPTSYVNDDKNRGRWDGLLILTDGGAPKPGPCKIRRGWVYPESCKLEFETDETKIVMSDRAGGLSEAS